MCGKTMQLPCVFGFESMFPYTQHVMFANSCWDSCLAMTAWEVIQVDKKNSHNAEFHVYSSEEHFAQHCAVLSNKQSKQKPKHFLVCECVTQSTTNFTCKNTVHQTTDIKRAVFCIQWGAVRRGHTNYLLQSQSCVHYKNDFHKTMYYVGLT